jgi:hypothetical protein
MKIVAKTVFGLFVGCVAVWAQTSQISGVIRDASGLVIQGAEIKATQTATGVVRATTSAPDGAYAFPNLPIGPYQLEVTHEGFTKYVQSGILLQVDTQPTIDVGLRVGSVTEQVTVEANAIQVETRTASIGGVVDNKQIMEMPLNGRDAHELVFLAGMANNPGDGSMNSIRNYPTVVVSVAGGNGDGVSYLLDGVIHQDPYNSLSLPLPFPDALQEFKVETSAAPAQYGYHATATVTAVTRSGSNSFHGDLFEYLRNGDLNARDFFATQRDTLKRNQFGGTIGGPIKKDKLFFFGGYQRTSLRSDPVQNTAFVPTPAMASGNFSAIATSLKDPRDPTGQTFFPGNQVPTSLLSPVSLNILKTFPTPIDASGRTINGQVAGQDENLTTAKIDWQVNPKHTVFGRYLDASLDKRSTFDGKNPLSINFFAVQPRDYGLALGDTWLISTNLVNSFRVGANRTNVPKINDNYVSWSSVGANITPLAGNIIGLNIIGTGVVFGGGNASPGAQHNGPLWSVLNDLTWVKGSHQFGFGGSIFQQRLNYWSGTNAVGVATYDGSVTGSSLADFMLGRALTFSQGTNYGFYTRQYYMSLYAQDSWKILPRLTLNYGVRWEPYLAPYNNRGENQHFDRALFTQNVHSTVFTNAPAGLFFPGDSQYTCGDAFTCPRWNKFFPRVGLAWDPRGNGRMTIRAGYGMYGDRAMMLAGSAMYFDPPFGNTLNLSGVDIANPWANYPGATGLPAGQNPMPTLSSLGGIGVYSHSLPFPAFGGYVNSPLRGFNPVYMNQWNLSLETQVRDWLLSANYVGNSTIHMISGENVNLATYIPGNCDTGQFGLRAPGPCSTTANTNQRRALYLQNAALGQAYSGIGQIDDGGTQSYDGLNLSARRALSHGFTAGANYTWSHCIGDPYNQNPPAGAGVAPPNNRRQWRSNCNGPDVRQLFTLNLVATTPKFSNRALRILGSDWQVAPILSIKSAQFFTVYSGFDNALSGQTLQTPNLVNTNPYPANQSVDNWISKSAFAWVPGSPGAPLPPAYGNLGYNNMKGPGVFQLNLALSRNFRVAESKTIQLRAEAFNLPNHLNAAAPGAAGTSNNNLTAPNFGKLINDISGNNGIGAGDYRVIQLAMKFIF